MLPMPFLAFAGGGEAGPALNLVFAGRTPAQIAAAGVTAGRSGLGWQYDATGKITTCPNNLLLNTATLSTQTVSVAAGNYVLSITGTGSVALSSGASGTLAGTGVSNRVHLAFTATGSTTFTVTGSVTSARLSRVTYETTMRVVDDVDTTGSAYYGPRLDFDPITLAAKGLLVEPAATNAAPNSDDITNVSWSKASVSFTGNAAVSPDGTTTADLIYPTSTGSNRLIFIGAGAARPQAPSYYVKAAGLQWVALGTNTNTADVAFFNVSTGAIGAVGANMTGAKIEALPDGWFRLSVGATASATGAAPIALFVVSGDGSLSVTASGTAGVYVWQGQVEAGLSATSPIPTTTASVTRAAESVKFTPPVGVSNIRFTFSDDTTQDAAVTGGVEYTIPTNLNRPWIKSIVSI